MNVILRGKDETEWGAGSMRNVGGTGKRNDPQIRPRVEAEYPTTPKPHSDQCPEACDRAVGGRSAQIEQRPAARLVSGRERGPVGQGSAASRQAG